MAEVAIQGAGRAGCALALLLARQRHSVTVFELPFGPCRNAD
jgi:2-polyprenyl-6-methoxyphenol hydroxylase-like FAD-dependent oxidoreductase